MVKGLDTFREYFADYEKQYVLIGGAACDIVFESNEANFRATRDLDMVLIIEALTPEFGEKFWEFIVAGKYRNKATSSGNPQFYRFDKPEDDSFPKMIELFCRSDFELRQAEGITPIHIDDEISSLSAILLDDNYYKALLDGKVVREGLSVLRPEYIILFKAKAYLDLKTRKDSGEAVPGKKVPGTLPTNAEIGRDYCDRLFEIERNLKDLSPEERKVKRLELEKPILEAFWCWLENINALNGSALGKAVTYAKNQKQYMENYLLDGRCAISNNVAENAIRPFTVGRKNWLFADTPK